MQLPNFDHTRLVRIAGATAVAVLAAGWLTWAQVGSTGIIYGCVSASGQIRGIDESTGQCRANDQTLAWYTKQGADAMFLGREATATNADTLDGLDSTQFVRVTDIAELNATIATLTARIAALEAAENDGGDDGDDGDDGGGPGCGSDPSCTTDAVDVVFLIDATGDMAGLITNLRNGLQNLTVTLSASHPNTQFAVAQFRDFPIAPYGAAADQPFTLLQTLTANTVDVQNAVNSIQAQGGGDELEAGHEALYHVATTDLGFRAASKKLVFVVTSGGFHNDYGVSFHDRSAALQALLAINAKVIGVTSTTTARETMIEYAVPTGAVVSPAAFGSLGGCSTGINGSQVAPLPDGTCPLVFQVATDGFGINAAIVDAVALMP